MTAVGADGDFAMRADPDELARGSDRGTASSALGGTCVTKEQIRLVVKLADMAVGTARPVAPPREGYGRMAVGAYC